MVAVAAGALDRGGPMLWSEGGSWGVGAADSAWATANWAALCAIAARCARGRG